MSRVQIFTPIGASNHTDGERPKDDFYATEPKAAELLLDVETFNRNIWECACGEGHLAKVFTAQGYEVRSSDIIDRGYGDVLDFLQVTEEWAGDIITNPPYKYALEFAEKALQVVRPGGKVALFLKLTFLEGKRRKPFFQSQPPPHCLCIGVPAEMWQEWRFYTIHLQRGGVCVVCVGKGIPGGHRYKMDKLEGGIL